MTYQRLFGDDFFEHGDILHHIMDEQLNEGALQYVNTDDRRTTLTNLI